MGELEGVFVEVCEVWRKVDGKGAVERPGIAVLCGEGVGAG